MICTKCGLRQATTEVLQRYNDKVEKMYLCNECAKEYRPNVGFDDFGMLDKLINGSPMGLLTGLSEFFNNTHESKTVRCPDCRTTGEEFLKTGFVGCPRCYEVFEPLIRQTVKKLQQSERHIGKRPNGTEADDSVGVAQLKADLQEAIDCGDYARARVLSSKLEKIERSGDN
ncbi:MAG: hypothetical protein K2M48_04210 [Clostridiales bacterium]|nr:hypothetical protein [Clostridiales bacterium]